MHLKNCYICDPKTLIMRTKRAHDVTTTMTSSNPTSVETGRIRKSSWNSAFCTYHSTPSVLCLLHSYSILLEKRYLTGDPYSPSMHSSPQVLRCFFQSEPPPLSVSFVFQSHGSCVRAHEISCYAIARQQQPIVFHRPVSGHIGLLFFLQYRTYHFIIHSLIVLFLPTFLTAFLSFCVC